MKMRLHLYVLPLKKEKEKSSSDSKKLKQCSKGKSFNTVGIVLGINCGMSENIITSFSEKSKDVLKKEYETMVDQMKEMLGECKRKALSKI